jgi:hypothetical protein
MANSPVATWIWNAAPVGCAGVPGEVPLEAEAEAGAGEVLTGAPLALVGDTTAVPAPVAVVTPEETGAVELEVTGNPALLQAARPAVRVDAR